MKESPVSESNKAIRPEVPYQIFGSILALSFKASGIATPIVNTSSMRAIMKRLEMNFSTISNSSRYSYNDMQQNISLLVSLRRIVSQKKSKSVSAI
jgi:hypothetical protein